MVKGCFGRAVGAPRGIDTRGGSRGVEDDAALSSAEMGERGCDLGDWGLDLMAGGEAEGETYECNGAEEVYVVE